MKFVWALLWTTLVAAAVWAEEKNMVDSQGEEKLNAESEETKEEADARVDDGPTTSPSNHTHPPPFISSSRPVDCADHLIAGETKSGVYQIYPFSCSCSKAVLVWCDMETDGGGWTVFLSRQDANQQLNFNRTWYEYRDGFGSPYEEYYMGNELLHVMTQSRAYTLRLDLQQATGGLNYATYETIRVSDEDSRYQMSLAGSLQGTSSTTNCFKYMNGRYFTTLDRDYDSYSGNCAANHGGGWWYYNCRYFNPTSAGFNQSMELVCYTFKVQVTKLQLMLRPQICDSSFKTIHLKDLDCGCQVPQ